MERIDVEGWVVVLDAPTLRIETGEGDTVFATDEWSPNMSDPYVDGLAWAGAIADAGSGLTVDHDDDPAFGEGVRRVRAECPPMFADTCAMLSQLREDEQVG